MKNKNLVLGLALITIGGLWFLDNLNLGFSIRYLFRGISDLWPLILVFLGISILSNNKRLSQIIWVVFFIILIAYSVFTQYNGSFFNRTNFEEPNIVNNYESHDYSPFLEEGVTKGILDIDIGATRFEITGSDIQELALINSNLFGLNYYDNLENSNTQKLSINNDDFQFGFDGDYNYDTNFLINENLIWNVELDCGAVDGIVDLTNTPVESFNLDMGAGKLELLLGNKSVNTKVSIDSGVSEINILIPKDTGVKIALDGALNSTNFDSLGLINIDDEYYSQNYDNAQTQYDFDIDMGLGSLNIQYID